MSDYDWLYEQRFVLKKSKEKLADELGCSTTVVNKWLKHHNMPNVRYNESNTDVLLCLRDFDWLNNKYKVERLTCEQIADELGTTKSTVSIWLNKHDITANPSNSYERKVSFVSKEEVEVLDFIKSIYTGEIQTSVRTICPTGLEIDIYIPDMNLAIEYNGVYSHQYRPNEKTFSAIKGPKYHLQKTLDCEAKGIKLIHIFSSSWNERKDVWKNYIKNQLNLNEHRIYARSCEIVEIDTHDKNVFLEENHIQGQDKSKFKYGLYHEGVLVSVMTFSSARFTKSCDWELSRFAVKGNYTVIGAFSKLLAHMKKTNPGSIISYADRSYSNGKVYEKNGFELIKTNRPSYYYIHKNSSVLINRMNLTKKNLLKKLNKPHLTEEELAFELGYAKIFDCGTLAYMYK